MTAHQISLRKSEPTGSEPAALHRAEHLDLAHGIEAEAAGDTFRDELD